MASDSSDIKTLFAQIVAGEISAQDRARFDGLILRPENDGAFSQVLKEFREENTAAGLLDADLNDGKYAHTYSDSDWEPLIQLILSQKSQPHPIRRIPGVIRYAAAAAVVAGLSFGTYFLVRKTEKSQNPNTNIAKTQSINVLPGTNKATLTLGNGATMVLDSEALGTLAQQGNTRIIKTDSGRLAYTVEKNNQSSDKSASNKSASDKVAFEENILTTPRGGQYQLVLPDGTKVWLNAASSITYPTAFTGNQRFVKVTGEAYFEVVHNAKMPFVVKVRDQVITDIGTEFNINAYPEEGSITTTLINGSVKIFKGSKTNILIPNQQEIASVEGESVTIKSNVEVQKFIAWRKGQFEFNETKLPVIMRQISRWYDVDVKYEGQIPDEAFGGGISRNLPLSDVLKLLEANGLHFRLENKTLFVSQNQTK